MWLEKKRPASFRGVPFYINDSQLGAGRRLARHEYPQRDLPYLEDMGRKAREYKVDAYVLGPEYMDSRDALLAAIEKPGPGQLVHPWHGTVQVVAQDCQLSESTSAGGYAKFSITFVEAGRREAPAVTPDTAGIFSRAKARVQASMETVYADTLDFVGQPVSVVQDGLETLDELRALPGVAASIASLSGYGAAINILASTEALAGLLDPVLLVRGVQALASGLVDLSPLIGFDREELPAVTSTAILRNNNRSQLELMVRQAGVVEQVDRILAADYASVDLANEARGEIVAAVDQVLLHPSLDHRCTQSVIDFRTAALAHMKAISPKLPVLIDVENRAVRPAIVVAHEHYGDGWMKNGKDASLIAINKVRHPGFVPNGTLQLEVVNA